jgi:hypothetical protein
MTIKNKSTNQSTPTRVFRNIHAAANHRVVNTTSNLAVRGVERTAKWVSTDHVGTAERSDLMALQQDASFIIAKMTLENRRSNRNNSNILTFIAGWVIDYGLYIFDLLWGFIWPILMMLILNILSAILIAALVGLTFYLLFQFLIM